MGWSGRWRGRAQRSGPRGIGGGGSPPRSGRRRRDGGAGRGALWRRRDRRRRPPIRRSLGSRSGMSHCVAMRSRSLANTPFSERALTKWSEEDPKSIRGIDFPTKSLAPPEVIGGQPITSAADRRLRATAERDDEEGRAGADCRRRSYRPGGPRIRPSRAPRSAPRGSSGERSSRP